MFRFQSITTFDLKIGNAAGILFAVFCCVGHASVASAGSDYYGETTLRGKTMGPISWQVTLVWNQSESSIDRAAIQQAIQETLDGVNDLMSTWKPDSEVSRFNQSRSTDWFVVSQQTAEVVQLAQTISQQTGGAFDITVMPLVGLWNFGPDKSPSADFAPPTPEELKTVQSRVGYRKLEVRTEPPALRKLVPELTIDLSAIAKGYAVDQVVELLQARQLPAFLVEVGGEVRSVGRNARGRPWSIGIEAPSPGIRRPLQTTPLLNAALATSGDYRNFIVYQGRRYSHTVDPRSGQPVTHDLRSVSVRAETCVEADAAATAIMVLGSEAGQAWANQRGLSVLFVSSNPETKGWIVTKSAEFEAIPVDADNVSEQSGGSPVSIWLITLGVFLGMMGLMAIGVIFSNRRIQGSCGGLANLKDERGNPMCEACTTPSPTCSGDPTGAAVASTVSESASHPTSTEN